MEVNWFSGKRPFLRKLANGESTLIRHHDPFGTWLFRFLQIDRKSFSRMDQWYWIDPGSRIDSQTIRNGTRET